MTDAWGWAGWVAIVALPLAFWGLIVAFFVVLLRSDAPVEVERRVPVAEPSRQRSGLGWRPPVPQHHH